MGGIWNFIKINLRALWDACHYRSRQHTGSSHAQMRMRHTGDRHEMRSTQKTTILRVNFVALASLPPPPPLCSNRVCTCNLVPYFSTRSLFILYFQRNLPWNHRLPHDMLQRTSTPNHRQIDNKEWKKFRDHLTFLSIALLAASLSAVGVGSSPAGGPQ